MNNAPHIQRALDDENCSEVVVPGRELSSCASDSLSQPGVDHANGPDAVREVDGGQIFRTGSLALHNARNKRLFLAPCSELRFITSAEIGGLAELYPIRAEQGVGPRAYRSLLSVENSTNVSIVGGGPSTTRMLGRILPRHICNFFYENRNF